MKGNCTEIMEQIDKKFHSLSGMCTIRLISDKYDDMDPGNVVMVEHKKNAGDVSNLITEWLTVRAMAIGSLRELVYAFAYDLSWYGLDLSGDEVPYDQLIKQISAWYTHDDTESSDFVAIFFN